MSALPLAPYLGSMYKPAIPAHIHNAHDAHIGRVKAENFTANPLIKTPAT